MAYGERFAIEGLLGQLRPALALETGTAQGGSLRRIAHYAEEVHSFDIDPHAASLNNEVPNAVFHIGDSAELLPAALAQFAEAGRHLDFALIDGDHTAEGVQRDTQALLSSDACRNTVFVFHDTANDDVRAGLDALNLPAHPKVILSLLDFVPGYLCVRDHPTYPLATWNGLGLVILGDPAEGGTIVDTDHVHVGETYRRARSLLRTEESASPPPPPQPPAQLGWRMGVSAGVGGLVGAAVALAVARRR
jgi:hypothetical protein